jgi:hypothetical protein
MLLVKQKSSDMPAKRIASIWSCLQETEQETDETETLPFTLILGPIEMQPGTERLRLMC